MSTSTKFIIATLFYLVLVAIFLPLAINSPHHYKGNLVFNSEEEYIKFKETVVETNAIWKSNSDTNLHINAVSSAPPILVDFEVKVDKFPYGEIDNNNKVGNIIASIALPLVLCMLVLMFWSINGD